MTIDDQGKAWRQLKGCVHVNIVQLPRSSHPPAHPFRAMADAAPSPAQRWFAGRCYCGGITFRVSDSCDASPPPPSPLINPPLLTPPPSPPGSVRALFCHCDSCRRAHAAPLYQVVYLPESCFEITAGAHLLQPFARSPAHVVRSFCGACGSRVCNRVPAKPSLGVGFFPNLLDEGAQKALPEVGGGWGVVVAGLVCSVVCLIVVALQLFKPTEHYLSHEVHPPPPLPLTPLSPPPPPPTQGGAGLELLA